MRRIPRYIRRIQSAFETAIDRPMWFRFAIATLLVFVAFAIRYSLNPILRDQLPFLFFITSSMLSSALGGFSVGIYSLLLGWLLGDYYFVLPKGVIGQYGKLEVITLISTLVPSLIAITLIQFLHVARRRARTEIEQRKKTETELVQARARLQTYAKDLEHRVGERTSELEQSIKFLEGFCYSIAHDLRAPLRAIEGFIYALRQDYAASFDETGKEYANRIVGAAQRMDRLVSDLLEYGRLSHQKLEPAEVSLDAVVDASLWEFTDHISNQHASVHVAHPLGTVSADKTLLKMVLVQLISNALKFCPPERTPEIDISGERMNGTTRLSIRDNGRGIAPAHQQKIFRLFETLDAATNLATGAGLALVSKAVERMQGKVGVESEVGRGSTFWIELPNCRKAAAGVRRVQHV